MARLVSSTCFKSLGSRVHVQLAGNRNEADTGQWSLPVTSGWMSHMRTMRYADASLGDVIIGFEGGRGWEVRC